MKKLLCIMGIFLMLGAPAFGEVVINAANFPDVNFRNYVSKYCDKDKDGVLNDTELRSVTSISINQQYKQQQYTPAKQSVSSFRGIEYFTSLSALSCYNNSITELDVSKNSLLQTLDCSGCWLTSLNLSNNSALQVLNCSSNLITDLDLSSNPALETLNCSNNRLAELDISINAALTSLNCSNNYIAYIDAGNNIALSTIDCSNNHIASLNLDKNIMLRDLFVSNNYLRKLDVSTNKNLTQLDCSNNFLTALDLSSNIALERLSCSYNRITELDLSKNKRMSATGISERIIQRIPGIGLTDNGDGTFTFDLKTIIAPENLSKAVFPSYISYNQNTGIITLNAFPASIIYTYDMGYIYAGTYSTMTVALNPDLYADMKPVITTVVLSNGTAGTKYSLALQSSGSAATLWSVIDGALPDGIGLSPDGTLSGMPIKAGTYEFTVKAENSSGSDTRKFTLVINPDPSVPTVKPAITTSSLTEGTSNKAYSYTLKADGDLPITWQITDGTLPSGLNLSTSGIISGTTSLSGSFDITVQAYNSVGSDTKTFTLSIINSQAAAAKPVITTSGLPDGTEAISYNASLKASGTAPITWSITAGSIPRLTLSSAGVLSGTPTSAGKYTITVQAQNSSGIDTKTFTVNIEAPMQDSAPSISTSTLSKATEGVGYGETLKASGTAPITWSITAGSIPGLTLSAAGLLSGTPAEAGTFTITVQAQNAAGKDSRTLTLTVEEAPENMKPVITTLELEPATKDTEYIFQLTASGTPPITWEIIKGKLPKGMALSSSGKFSGLVSISGKKTFTVKASNAYGSDSRIFTLQGYIYPEITKSSLEDATVGKYYDVTISKKGSKPLTWKLEGNLPPGLIFDPAERTIKGKPSLDGTYTIKFTLSNPVGEASKTFTLKVNSVLPKISPSSLSNGTIGKLYKKTITASGTKPITLSLTGFIPEGLVFNETTGMIYGTPLEECTNLPLRVIASNTGGTTEKLYYLTIKGSAPKITTASIPAGSAGNEYNAEIQATGTAPIIWSAAGLPAGLFMNNGVISGVPIEAGTFKVEVIAANSAKTVSKKFILTITSPPEFLDNSILPSAEAGKSYTHKLNISGTKTITVNLTGGKMPNGMSISGMKLKGRPSEAGTFTFTLTARNSAGISEQEFTITVNGVPPSITTNSLKTGTQGKSYKATLKSAGTAPLEWSVEGNLPAGIDFSDGVFSGTPAEAFDGYIYVTVTNSWGKDIKSFRLLVKASKTNTKTSYEQPSTNFQTEHKNLQEVNAYSEDYMIVYELPEISADISGMHDFDVVLSCNVPVGAKLVWLANSSEPSDDDNIAEFYSSDGEEIDAVPEDRKISIEAWLNEGVIYKPVIAIIGLH